MPDPTPIIGALFGWALVAVLAVVVLLLVILFVGIAAGAIVKGAGLLRRRRAERIL